MAQITVNTQIITEDDTGRRYAYNYGRTITDLTEIRVQQIAVASGAANSIVWDPTVDTSDPIQSFTFLAMAANGNLDAGFTANEGDGNEELDTKRLVQGIPFMLGSDVSYYNHSANNPFGGTADVIDKISVDEPDSSAVVLDMIMAR